MLQDLNEISDGKIYRKNDMVRAACGGCAGCHACCVGMGNSIILDPLDVWHLTLGTGKNFQQLLVSDIELHVVEGIILPNLKMAGSGECCSFLNEEGRCSIHPFRPGLCRVFPLGRIYEKEEICYFLQSQACPKNARTKIKVSKWLDASFPEKYDQFLLIWHKLRSKTEQVLHDTEETQAKTINVFLLNLFYGSLYQPDGDFYECFYKSLKQAAAVLPFLEE